MRVDDQHQGVFGCVAFILIGRKTLHLQGFAITRSKVEAIVGFSALPHYKMVLLTWLGIFSLITALLALLGPWLNSIPLVLRRFILTGLLVPLMTYVVMPWLTKRFNGWLYLPDGRSLQKVVNKN